MTTPLLDQIKVIDFTTMLAGGGTTRLLADCGATVTKIESPDGDMLRAYEQDRISLNFGYYNAGKKCIVLDLKNPTGAGIALDLIRQADIVVENFRPGTMAKFGLHYEAVEAARPGIIYCSITGFGQYGPLAGRAAYAPVAHAFSGYDMLVSPEGGDEAGPIQNGVVLADTLTPAYAFGAIQAALFRRERTGQGSRIDVSMAESMMHMLSLQMLKGQEGARTREDYRGIAHPPYRTLDGYINIPIASVATQHALYRVIGQQQWIDDLDLRTMSGLRRRRSEINAAIAQWTAVRTNAECDEIMTRAGVPSAIYHLPHELLDHPHLIARDAWRPAVASGIPFQILRPPFQFDGENLGLGEQVCELGQDTAEILANELSIGGDALHELAAQGAFGNWRPDDDAAAGG